MGEKLNALSRHIDEQTARARQGFTSVSPRSWDDETMKRARLYDGVVARYLELQFSYLERTRQAIRDSRQGSGATSRPVQ